MEQNLQIIAVALNPAIDRVLEVPNFKVGAHQSARTIARYPAGKAVNVARVLGLLDVPCTLTGLIGQGEVDYFESELAGSKVQMQLLVLPGSTRENVTIVDPAAHVETHLRDVGFEVAERDITRLKKKLLLLAGEGRLFVFSGSLPQGIAPADLADMVALCKNAGARVAVDASGAALAAAVEVRPWLIKPNQQELQALTGNDTATAEQIVQAATKLTDLVETVLVSCGAEGGYLFADKTCLYGKCSLEPERIANTVGCGDSLLAGFLAGLYKGQPLPEAYRLALAVAAATATHLEAAKFTPQEIEEFLRRSEVQPIEG